MQLTQALTLVPERTREDKEEKEEKGGLSHVSLESLMGILSGPSQDMPLIEFDLPKIFDFYSKKGKDTNNALHSISGIRKLLSDSWTEEGEESLIEEMIDKVVSSSVRRLGIFIVRFIWGAIWRVTKWLVKEVVGGVVKNVLRYLVMPALEAVVEFMFTPVGLAIALTGGALAAGYLIYKAFFDKGSDKSLKSATDSLTGNSDDDLGSSNTQTGTQQPSADYASPYNAPVASGAPVAIQPSSVAPAKGLADLITKGESRSSNPYDVVNMPNANNGRGGAGTRPLEKMTVGQVLAAQASGDFNAAGRYQIINSTLKGAVAALHLTGNELFDNNLQDKIFNEYLVGPKKRPHLYAYLHGQSNDVVAAALDASEEWASVAAPQGTRLRSGATADGLTSYYDNSRNNKASIPAAQMIATLEQERAERDGTSVASNNVKVTPGTTTAATTQNKVAAAQTASHPGTTVPTASSNTTIMQTPGGQMVAANMN
jgi:muramidase (phage lysozyme)